ncbi:MAG TPA: SGNH/GDSL hydrolase family protein [Vicinamibacterales bacterium]|nr:SGNH/GDSL hydrolase family protein [Vicinamibacterales bacterium]
MKRKLLILAAVLAVSGCAAVNSPSDPPPNPNIVLYTAIGASDTTGFGSSVPCLPLTSCPDGTGYVQTIERRLRTSGKSVTLLNLGIPGAVLAPEVQAIGNQLGRGIVGNFIEREIPFVQRNATLVSVFAGGNDANTIGAAIAAGFGGVNPLGYVQTQTDNFGRDLRTLIAGIKERAPQARIVVLNLPNMAGLPYASGYTPNEKRWLQTIAVGFSAQVNKLGSQGVLVIDLMCDAAFYQGGMYSGDGFHPNDAGYSRLADFIVAAANTGSVTPPRASCSQMTLF